MAASLKVVTMLCATTSTPPIAWLQDWAVEVHTGQWAALGREVGRNLPIRRAARVAEVAVGSVVMRAIAFG
ncbi:MAG: hypothetical protein ACYDHU_10885 [Acidimicrobiales bacterium]